MADVLKHGSQHSGQLLDVVLDAELGYTERKACGYGNTES